MPTKYISLVSRGGNTEHHTVIPGSDLHRNLLLAGYRVMQPEPPVPPVPEEEPADSVPEDVSDEDEGGSEE